jgi:hypothetical protein
MSRPRVFFVGFATLLGAFLALVLARFLPAPAIARTVAPLKKFEHVGGLGLGVRAVSLGPGRQLFFMESSKLIRYVK